MILEILEIICEALLVELIQKALLPSYACSLGAVNSSTLQLETWV